MTDPSGLPQAYAARLTLVNPEPSRFAALS